MADRGRDSKARVQGTIMKRVEEDIDITKLEETAEEMMKIVYLDSKNSSFSNDESGFIILNYNGCRYEHVDIFRTFPYSSADTYLSVRKNEGMSEIGIIRDLKEFDDITIQLINNHLNLRYFTPEITEILYTKMRAGVVTMKVRTKFGENRFSFRTNANAVVKLQDNRVFIQDLDDNRYQITDVTKLSIKQQKKLDVLL